MRVSEIISFLETLAHPSLQESYDNSGLIAGNGNMECTGIICCLDVLPEVIEEAVKNGCNLIVAHHPIVFKGIKQLNGKNYVERTLIQAIKADIAIYAIHTNLDNVQQGVNGRIASMLGLTNLTILQPRQGTLCKLQSFVPTTSAGAVLDALFAAGAGHIGNYSECSFSVPGTGSFKAGENANPFVGKQGLRQLEPEVRIEVVLPRHLQHQVVQALLASHPYEEVAYDMLSLENAQPGIGSGIVGDLPEEWDEREFLMFLKEQFGSPVIRHSQLLGKVVKRAAVCGGAGSFLISKALRAGADVFVTADLKYHEFFDAESRLVLADIGHYESEQYTIALLQEFLEQKFPTFAVLKTEVITNPVNYI